MKIVIIGAAELGNLIATHAINDSGFEVVGFYDDHAVAKKKGDIPIIGKTDTLLADYKKGLFDAAIIGIGYNQMSARMSVFERFKGRVPFANVIHSSSYVDSTCELGEGIFILPGVTVDLGVCLSDNVLLNTGVTVAHHTNIGSHTFIAPGVKIAGLVNVGEGCFIGIGSNIKDCINIKPLSIIGAGSLVLEDTQENSLTYGAPARCIKFNS